MAWNSINQEDRAVSFKVRRGLQEDEAESLKEAGREAKIKQAVSTMGYRPWVKVPPNRIRP